MGKGKGTMKRMILIFLMGALSCTPLFAETVVPGGSVFGTWTLTGSPYLVQGHITVQDTSSLVINPGVTVIFQGQYLLTVEGLLNANGTPSDSIHFIPVDQPNRYWAGIRFYNAPDFSHLTYCVIRKAQGFDCYNKGGGLYFDHSDPVISHCSIVDNNSPFVGGGLACYFSNPTMSQCNISNNQADYDGGAIYLDNSSPSFQNCVFNNNHSMGNGGAFACTHGSSAMVSQCTISNNIAGGNGGGVFSDFSNPELSYCGISGNQAGTNGGGIYCSLYADLILNHSSLHDNSAQGGSGGGLYVTTYSDPSLHYTMIIGNSAAPASGGGVFSDDGCQPVIDHCTIRGNSGVSGGGVHCGQSGPIITNSIIEGNLLGGGLYFGATQFYNQIRYNDVNNNQVGNFLGSSVPLLLGVRSMLNSNADSCDQFHNISYNPMFVDPGNQEFDLIWGSPCIDAGDPTALHDPDETITDMGALPFDQNTLPPQAHVEVSSFSLSYGPVWIMSSSTKALKIYNTGDTTLVLYSLATTNPAAFTINWNIADSLVLPGDSVTVNVVFHPPTAQFYIENLTINNNDVQVNVSLIGTGSLTGIIENGTVPLSFNLQGPYPNPFNPNTTFTLSLPKAVDVDLSIFDVNGKLVDRVMSGRRAAGVYQIGFENLTLPSGMYLYRLQAGEYNSSGKMVLVK
jgi:parallel beta-helix repeat protein/predicted outer membrane repeat protein